MFFTKMEKIQAKMEYFEGKEIITEKEEEEFNSWMLLQELNNIRKNTKDLYNDYKQGKIGKVYNDLNKLKKAELREIILELFCLKNEEE